MSVGDIVNKARAVLRANAELIAIRNAEIQKRVDDGEALDAIAQTYGLSRQRVQQLAGTHRRKQKQKEIAARDEAIKGFVSQGMTTSQISSKVGLDRNYVSSIIYRLGLKPNRKSCRHSTMHAVCLMLQSTKTLTEIADITGVAGAVVNALSGHVRKLGFQVMCMDGRSKENRKKAELPPTPSES